MTGARGNPHNKRFCADLVALSKPNLLHIGIIVIIDTINSFFAGMRWNRLAHDWLCHR